LVRHQLKKWGCGGPGCAALNFAERPPPGPVRGFAICRNPLSRLAEMKMDPVNAWKCSFRGRLGFGLVDL
jgi:hypothetical protein